MMQIEESEILEGFIMDQLIKNKGSFIEMTERQFWELAHHPIYKQHLSFIAIPVFGEESTKISNREYMGIAIRIKEMEEKENE